MDAAIQDFESKLKPFCPRDQERIRSALAGDGSPRAVETAAILADLNLDADTLVAALVLNAHENSKITLADIESRFGREPALLAEGAARIAKVPAKNKTLQEAENIRNMLFAMVRDIRVIFIRLADKLYTLRAGEGAVAEQRKQAAQESLDIYAPLAGRLGISWIKDELEDLALKQINGEAYRQIKQIVSEKRGERRDFLDRIQGDIEREAAAAGFKVEVYSRAKHFYSIYQKMRKRNKASADLYDLFGTRIICESIENCYTLLGLVHRLWKPLDGRFKDYIAMPKSNGYQSLHTTVIVPGRSGGSESGGDTRLVEIQIRTGEMHHIAENGIASHWLYKRGSARELPRPVDISIINRLRDWKETESDGPGRADSKAFLEEIKREILKDSIYVFTPQGKVIELPSGATPIDFAYHIHSAIGEHCAGAKADGAIVPLSSELKNTQVVEILTSTQAHPHINWLRIVKTAKARNKIRAWLQQNDEAIIIEKNIVAKKKSPPQAPLPSPPPAEKNRETPAVQELVPAPGTETDIFRVRVEDEKNLMIRFARCCRPITGDPIIGYISRGRGIIIHRRNCGNLANIPDFQERKIDTEWENAGTVLVKRFRIEARSPASAGTGSRPSSPDLFSGIEGAVRKNQGHLIEGRLEETSPSRLTGFFTLQLESPGDLKKVLKNIRGIPGILTIRELV
ncbi:MAG: HD domain-containing protein [Treponema sp.]|jgi:GTP pyrophosphokinase|nr:HD domain-containing protein [Treponema sp.]